MTAAYESLAARASAYTQALGALDVPRLIVGISGCSLSVGAGETLAELKAELARRGIKAQVETTGCKGMCYCEPQVDVVLPGKPRITYGNVGTDRVAELVESVLVRGDLRSDWAECHWSAAELPGVRRASEHPFFKDQTRNVTVNWGLVDPESLDSSIAAGAYRSLDKALSTMTPEQVIEEVKASNISGRGGAAFPAGIKWQAARASRDRPKYVICNGEEGEPAIYKDRRMLEADPHRVIEGVLINGYAIGAEHAYMYVGGEHYVAIERLTKALADASAAGLVGKNILGTDFSMDIQIRAGAGSYAVGESSAIMSSIEGRRGQPRPKLVRSAERGVWAKPTCMNNVETHSNIPLIIEKGAAWYSTVGTAKSAGTKIFALSGNIQHPGLIEAPMGTTLRKLIEMAGGMRPGHTFKAAQPGGVSSAPIGTADLDVQMALETLHQIDALLGSGGIVVFDDSVCMVDMTRYLVNFSELESCSRCTACRVGSMRLTDILSRISSGDGRMEDLDTLEWLKKLMERTTLCGLGQAAATPAFGAARVFRAEFEAHIKEKRCPAGVCEALAKPVAHAAL